MMKRNDPNAPLYMISVVSRMFEIHPQTLRLYEREGFVCPTRVNKQRLYSEEDLKKLNLVIQLTRDLGVNRAGVDIILRMRQRMQAMQELILQMMHHLDPELREIFKQKLEELSKELGF